MPWLAAGRPVHPATGRTHPCRRDDHGTAVRRPRRGGGRRGWVTRRDLALLSGRSEDTIKRDVAEHGFPTRKGAAGAVLVRVADFVGIGRLQRQDVPAGGSAGQAAELKRTLVDNARLAAQVAELTGRLSAATAAQDVVIVQLGMKDQQIKDRLALERAAR